MTLKSVQFKSDSATGGAGGNGGNGGTGGDGGPAIGGAVFSGQGLSLSGLSFSKNTVKAGKAAPGPAPKGGSGGAGGAASADGNPNGTAGPDGLDGFDGAVGHSGISAGNNDFVGKVVIVNPALPKATKGTSYSTSLQALGEVGALHWSIVKGHLPGGLTLNAKSGKLSGRPTASGMFSFEAEVKDSSRPAAVATKQFTIVVTAKG